MSQAAAEAFNQNNPIMPTNLNNQEPPFVVRFIRNLVGGCLLYVLTHRLFDCMRDRRRGSAKWDFWKQLTGIATVVIYLRTCGGSNGGDPLLSQACPVTRAS